MLGDVQLSDMVEEWLGSGVEATASVII
jgi:hypothetical protein